MKGLNECWDENKKPQTVIAKKTNIYSNTCMRKSRSTVALLPLRTSLLEDVVVVFAVVVLLVVVVVLLSLWLVEI